MRAARLLLLLAVALNTAGCGTFVAHCISRSPNLYPTWFAHGGVELQFNPRLLTNFVNRSVEVGPPPARLYYRVVGPANYGLRVTATNWMSHGEKDYRFTFRATVPAPTNQWTSAPRGTVILLHGYSLAQFSMLPWALQLGQEGWRCVLVDLRGHGDSTGRRIYFGVKETADLSQLLDALARSNDLSAPVDAVGESYGASLALRWKTVEPRVDAVVAISPYPSLSNAVLNIAGQYAGWVPRGLVKSGVKQLPKVLQIPAAEFDTTTVLKRKRIAALFVAGAEDKITPIADVERLRQLAAPGSELVVVPDATHEALTYYFKEIGPPLQKWLEGH